MTDRALAIGMTAAAGLALAAAVTAVAYAAEVIAAGIHMFTVLAAGAAL